MRRLLIGAVAVALALAGCGGSSGTSTVSATTSTTSTTTTATTTASPTVSTASAITSTTATTPDATRIPARFLLTPGGGLNPPAISAPGHTAIELTVRAASHDTQTHHVVVETSPRHALTISHGIVARVRLTGLANGSYPVRVDGVRRGRLVVGVAPGP